MLAHSIGMGLYEQPVIRWLEDDEWEACGYISQRHNDKFLLKRMPIRRFEDIDSSSITSMQIRAATIENMANEVIMCMDEIISNNPTVMPHDIAVVLLGNNKINYAIADNLCFKLESNGIKVWYAPRDVVGAYAESIVKAIDSATYFS